MRFLDWVVGVPGPTLVGARVTLRPPSASDYPEWRALRESSRAFLTPWEPRWTPDELSRGCYMARLARYRQDARARAGYTFLLRENRSNRLCGGITLGQIRRGVSQSGVLGYWMGEAFAGQGLMADAVRRLSVHAFEGEKLHRLEAACLPNNGRSIRLLEKSGFSHEGHLRKYLMIDGTWEDHRLYALLAEDAAARSGTVQQSASMPRPAARSTPLPMPQPLRARADTSADVAGPTVPMSPDSLLDRESDERSAPA